jgi:hypothetical protein
MVAPDLFPKKWPVTGIQGAGRGVEREVLRVESKS